MNDLFADKTFYKKIFAIAIPVACQHLIISSLNLVDTVMIGQLGEVPLAAVALANQFFFLFMAVMYAISSGTGVFASQFFGSNDIKGIRYALGLCLIFSLGAAAVFCGCAVFIPDQIISFFSSDARVVEKGAQFIRINGLGYVCMAVSFSFSSSLRSIRRPWLPFFISAIALAVNTILNYLLIFGKFGFPRMEVAGAATATVIARVIECVLFISVVYMGKYPLAARLRELLAFPKEYVRRFLRVWFPILLNDVGWNTGMLYFMRVYGTIGTDAVAAVSITDTATYFVIVFFLGTSSATQVLIGNTIGSRRDADAYIYAKRLLLLGPLCAGILSIVVCFCAPYITILFKVSGYVKAMAEALFIMFAVVFPFKVFNLHLVDGVLRSGADTRYGMFLDILGVWGIGAPLAYLSGIVLKLDLPIVYLIISSEEVCKCILGARRFASKKWIHNVARDIE